MKKKLNKMAVKELVLRERAREIITDNSGSSVFSDHAGLIIIGILALGLIIVWQAPYISNTLLPLLGKKVTDLFTA